MFFSCSFRAFDPCSFWMSSYVNDVKSDKSVAFPQRQISTISINRIFSASSTLAGSSLSAITDPFSFFSAISLYLAASASTAGLDDLKVEIFCRLKTS